MTPIAIKVRELLVPMLEGEEMIFADQNSPRPALPYWTLRLQLRKGLGDDAYSQGVDDEGDMEVYGVREGTVQVQRIGNGSEDKVQSLCDNLSKITVQEAWQVAEVALFDKGDVKSVPYPMDSDHLEPRASLDLFVRFGTKLIDRVGIIETVITDADYP